MLTDRKIRTAKPAQKPYRLHDGGGLALLIQPSGSKSWQVRYRAHGKPQTATLGKLDALPLAEARVAAVAALKLVEKGEHPTVAKRVAKVKKAAENAATFGRFAAAWIARESKPAPNWKGWTPAYTEEVKASLRNHLSALDGIPLMKITAQLVEPSLTKVEREAPMMLEKVHRRLREIMNDAVRKGLIPINPLPPPRRRSGSTRRHYPAVTTLPELGAILRDARVSDPCKGIERVHQLIVFTGLRVSEAVGAKWDEFDLRGVAVPIGGTHRTRHDPDAGNWRVPRQRMKRKDAERGDHVVPLPPVLLAMLREWRKADPGAAIYVCPAPRDAAKHITPEGCEKWMRDALKLGGKHSPHSWRSAFSTVCREAGRDADAVESQLDHVVGTNVASAYDRAKRLELRRELMSWYEATLISARDGADVLPMPKKPGS